MIGPAVLARKPGSGASSSSGLVPVVAAQAEPFPSESMNRSSGGVSSGDSVSAVAHNQNERSDFEFGEKEKQWWERVPVIEVEDSQSQSVEILESPGQSVEMLDEEGRPS